MECIAKNESYVIGVIGTRLWTTSAAAAAAASMPYQLHAWSLPNTLTSSRCKLSQLPNMMMVDVKPQISHAVPTLTGEAVPTSTIVHGESLPLMSATMTVVLFIFIIIMLCKHVQ